MDNGEFRDVAGNPISNRAQEGELRARAGEVVGEAVDEARRLGATARERLIRGADERKQTLAGRLEGWARKVEETSTRSGDEQGVERQLMDAAAKTLHNVSRSLSDRSTEEMIDLAGRKIRERPGLFLAGCVALGFLGARLLRR